jgi:hypothetical protein
MTAPAKYFDLWFIRPDKWRWAALAMLIASGGLLLYSAEKTHRLHQKIAANESKKLELQGQKGNDSIDLKQQHEQEMNNITTALNYDWNRIFFEAEKGVKSPWQLVSMSHNIKSPQIFLVAEINKLNLPDKEEFALNGGWKIVSIARQNEGVGDSLRLNIEIDSSKSPLRK